MRFFEHVLFGDTARASLGARSNCFRVTRTRFHSTTSASTRSSARSAYARSPTSTQRSTRSPAYCVQAGLRSGRGAYAVEQAQRFEIGLFERVLHDESLDEIFVELAEAYEEAKG
jgi:hypothetical protein